MDDNINVHAALHAVCGGIARLCKPKLAFGRQSHRAFKRQGQRKKYVCLGLHSKFWKGSVGRIYFLFFIPFFDIQYLLGSFLRSLRRTLPTLPALTQTHTSLQPHLPSLWDQGAKWSKECKTIYSTGALTNLVQVHPGKISCTAWLRRTEEEHQSQLM